MAGAALLFLKPEADPPTTGIPPSENFALTDSEAIETFKELNRLRLLAYSQKSLALIGSYATSDSPLRELAESDIKRLQARHVRVEPNFETKKLEVRSNSDSGITVRQWVLQSPRFYSDGEDVSRTHKPVMRIIDWFLQNDVGTWKIHDSQVISSREKIST